VSDLHCSTDHFPAYVSLFFRGRRVSVVRCHHEHQWPWPKPLRRFMQFGIPCLASPPTSPPCPHFMTACFPLGCVTHVLCVPRPPLYHCPTAPRLLSLCPLICGHRCARQGSCSWTRITCTLPHVAHPRVPCYPPRSLSLGVHALLPQSTRETWLPVRASARQTSPVDVANGAESLVK